MKLYTPPEMSMKLVALGCRSQSNIYWGKKTNGEWALYFLDSSPMISYEGLEEPPAFEFEDFGSMENHSIKNRILMKKKLHDFLTANNWVEEVGRGL